MAALDGRPGGPNDRLVRGYLVATPGRRGDMEYLAALREIDRRLRISGLSAREPSASREAILARCPPPGMPREQTAAGNLCRQLTERTYQRPPDSPRTSTGWWMTRGL